MAATRLIVVPMKETTTYRVPVEYYRDRHEAGNYGDGSILSLEKLARSMASATAFISRRQVL
jgi:hypothetical protein